MNCDNKYSKCCGCPAITNTPRELTLWSSSKLYNLQTMKKTGLINANDYRASLQANADIIMKNTVDDFDTNFKCKNNDSNLFYLDSYSYNNYYDSINVVSKKPEVENYHKNIAKGVLLDSMKSNMGLDSISLSSIESKNNKWN
jgi:hypothetical protein